MVGIAVYSLFLTISPNFCNQISAVTTVTITILYQIKNNTSKSYKAVTGAHKHAVSVTLQLQFVTSLLQGCNKPLLQLNGIEINKLKKLLQTTPSKTQVAKKIPKILINYYGHTY